MRQLDALTGLVERDRKIVGAERIRRLADEADRNWLPARDQATEFKKICTFARLPETACRIPMPFLPVCLARDQLRRASESIVLTLAEGSAKPSAKDRARYYSIALGSFRECQAALGLAEQTELLTRYDHLGGCLYRLARSASQ